MDLPFSKEFSLLKNGWQKGKNYPSHSTYRHCACTFHYDFCLGTHVEPKKGVSLKLYTQLYNVVYIFTVVQYTYIYQHRFLVTLREKKRLAEIMKESAKQTWTKTIKTSEPLSKDELTINMQKTYASPSEAVSADAHLAISLQHFPFELDGSAVPIKLYQGDFGEERGMDFVKSDAKTKDNDNTYGPMAKNRIKSLVAGLKQMLKLSGSFIFPFLKKPDHHQKNINNVTNVSNDLISKKYALYHLEKAAEMGNSEAQNLLANIAASGILPFDDHPEVRKGLKVQSDFADGGEQLTRAILLWHMSAMSGNAEAAITLGYRHFVSATSSGEKTKFITEAMLAALHEKGANAPEADDRPTKTKNNSIKKTDKILRHSSSSKLHYGVLGTCETSMAYYAAAAHATMDELETGPLRGKVSPARDHHKLVEIHQRGASSKLAYYNKPDELDEAIKYYKMRANNINPDIGAAYKVANMYHYGLRGVKQDMKEALKYYDIAAQKNSWEAAGQAGKFHFWRMGVDDEERDLKKAFEYFKMGTPGGLNGCKNRLQKKLSQSEKKVVDDGWGQSEKATWNCDHPAVNGMGLLHLFGVPMMVNPNVTKAIEYFELAKNMGNMDAYFNLAQMKLGWMNPYYGTAFEIVKRNGNINGIVEHKFPKRSDYLEAVELLKRAQEMGHIQAKHRLANIYAHGVEINSTIFVQPQCEKALSLYKEIALGGTAVSNRMRAAYKQYTSNQFEASLRNYLAAAEAGSVEAQVNAAFLLEQGVCLGMNRLNCMRASVRMWRAAARSGDEEACLRVGDFYYYGRLRENIENDDGAFSGVIQRDIDFSMAPVPWVRYVLYPEDIIHKLRKIATKGIKYLLSKNNSRDKTENDEVCSSDEMDTRTCRPKDLNDDASAKDESEDDRDHFEIAAYYYKKAADEHGSARANFNLGFMHEWGLGLTQDFPLAKRHFDLAAQAKNGEGALAVNIALNAMNLHETLVKASVSFTRFCENYKDQKRKKVDSGKDRFIIVGNRTTPRDIIIHHVFSGDTLLIIVLMYVLYSLVTHRLR